MANRKYIPAYFSYLDTLEDLSDEQVGKVFRAALKYAMSGETSELDTAEKIAFKFIKMDIEKSNSAYEEVCKTNAENGSKGGRPKKPNGFEENRTVSEKTERFLEETEKTERFSEKPEKPKEKEKEKENEKEISPDGDIEDGFAVPARAKKKAEPQKRFVPPTPEEVNAYCAEHGYNVDGQAFVDYYQRAGWKLKGNVPMKDWKAAVRTWVHHDKERRSGGGQSPGYKPDSNYGDMMEFLNAEIAKGGLDLEQSRDSPDSESAEDSVSGVLFQNAPF